MLYVGAGLWQSGKMRPAIIALRASTGVEVWSWVSTSHSQHGGVRGVIVDGERIIGTGYIESPETGFLFVADEASPAVWELDTSGNLVQEALLDRDLLPQGAKIRYGESLVNYGICSNARRILVNISEKVVLLIRTVQSRIPTQERPKWRVCDVFHLLGLPWK